MDSWQARAKKFGQKSGIVSDWSSPLRPTNRYELMEVIRKGLPPTFRCKIVNFTDKSIKEEFKKAQRFLLKHGFEFYLEEEDMTDVKPPKTWETHPLYRDTQILPRMFAETFAEDGVFTLFMLDEKDYYGKGHNGFCQAMYKPRYTFFNNDPKRKGEPWAGDFLAERIVHELCHLLAYYAGIRDDLHDHDYDNQNITNWLIELKLRIGRINELNEYNL